MKHKLTICLLVCLFISLFSSDQDFQAVIKRLMSHNSNYARSISDRDRDQSLFNLNKSINLADVNFQYSRYSNDISRDEDKFSDSITEEYSKIDEYEKSFQIEIKKKFFSKDFDLYDDCIGYSIDLMQDDYKLFLSYLTAVDDIITDYINWFEAAQMIPVISSEIALLNSENAKLTLLKEQNICSPQELASNLEDTLEKKAKLQYYQYLLDLYPRIYQVELQTFLSSYQNFIQESTPPDTLKFCCYCDDFINKSQKSAIKINKKIDLARLLAFLPQISTAVSYNWKSTEQDWNITSDDEYSQINRYQDETYPEISLQLSLPLNLVKNLNAKSDILNNYQFDLNNTQTSFAYKISELKLKYLKKLADYEFEFQNRSQLALLYQEIYDSEFAKAHSPLTITGDFSPKKMTIAEINLKKNKLKLKLAEMNYYKLVFLINYSGVWIDEI